MSSGLNDLALALSLRLRDITRMLDRLDRLESGTGEWLLSQGEGALAEAAREMTLRAFRIAADPANYAILAFLSTRTAAPIAELEKVSGLGRLILSERVNDLVQVGLIERNIDTNHVQGTAACAALVGLIESVSRATAKQLAEALQPVTR